jgi:hypothetical protein
MLVHIGRSGTVRFQKGREAEPRARKRLWGHAKNWVKSKFFALEYLRLSVII